MNYLDKTGLQYFWTKLNKKIPKNTSDLNNNSNFITSLQIEKIEVVNEYPEVEEENTLYIKVVE